MLNEKNILNFKKELLGEEFKWSTGGVKPFNTEANWNQADVFLRGKGVETVKAAIEKIKNVEKTGAKEIISNMSGTEKRSLVSAWIALKAAKNEKHKKTNTAKKYIRGIKPSLLDVESTEPEDIEKLDSSTDKKITQGLEMAYNYMLNKGRGKPVLGKEEPEKKSVEKEEPAPEVKKEEPEEKPAEKEEPAPEKTDTSIKRPEEREVSPEQIPDEIARLKDSVIRTLSAKYKIPISDMTVIGEAVAESKRDQAVLKRTIQHFASKMARLSRRARDMPSTAKTQLMKARSEAYIVQLQASRKMAPGRLEILKGRAVETIKGTGKRIERLRKDAEEAIKKSPTAQFVKSKAEKIGEVGKSEIKKMASIAKPYVTKEKKKIVAGLEADKKYIQNKLAARKKRIEAEKKAKRISGLPPKKRRTTGEVWTAVKNKMSGINLGQY